MDINTYIKDRNKLQNMLENSSACTHLASESEKYLIKAHIATLDRIISDLSESQVFLTGENSLNISACGMKSKPTAPQPEQ